MNKKILLIVLSIIFGIMGISVFAYENEKYYIEIPQDYEENITEELSLFINENGNFNIIVMDNINNANVVNFTNEEIKAIEKQVDDSLEDSGITNEILGSEKIVINNYNALLVKSRCKLSENAPNYLYQYKYIFTSENYVYYITHTISQIENSNKIDDILKTFKIKDELIIDENNENNVSNEINSNVFIFMIVLILIIILLFIAIIVVFIKLRKNK